MAYGTVKVDNITFDQGGADQNVTASGIYRAITSGVTVSGTIAGAVLIGTTTVSGTTVTGTTANFASGVFTTQVSGATVTGTQSSFTSGNFVTLSGATATFTSGVIASGTAAAPSLSILGDANTGIYSPGADQVAISTNGTGRVFVDANGNIGVGTTATNIATYKRIDIGVAGTSNGLLTLRSSGGAQEANISCSAAGLGFTTNSYATPFDARASEIIFGTGSSGTERMRLTSAGLLGLGTSSPVHKLDVADGDITLRKTTGGDTSGVTSQVLRIGTQSGDLACFYTISAGAGGPGGRGGDLFIQTKANNGNPTDRLVITNTGNVGIGTSSPTQKLHVSGGDTANVGFNGTTKGVRFDFDGTQSTIFGVDNTFFASYQPLRIGGSITQFMYGGNEAARIDSSGKLLVGTSTDFDSYLNQVSSTSGSLLSLRRTNSNPGSIKLSSGASGDNVGNNGQLGYLRWYGFHTSTDYEAARISAEVDGTPGAGDMPGRIVLSTTADGAASPTERMRVTSGGGVYVNSTSAPALGTELFGVAANSSGLTTAAAFANNVNTAPTLFIANSSNTTNTYHVRFASGSSGNTRGEIYYNGSQLVYATSSDYRLKENVEPLARGVDLIKQLRPVSYRWIESQQEDIGFIAHEVQEVFPNAVGGEKDAVDEDGKILPQTYDPSKLVPLLTAALQEAIARIETLEAAVAALEGE